MEEIVGYDELTVLEKKTCHINFFLNLTKLSWCILNIN